MGGIWKKKFTIKNDGVYIINTPITVKIKTSVYNIVCKEIIVILANPSTRMDFVRYSLAKAITAQNILSMLPFVLRPTSLIVYSAKALALVVVELFNNISNAGVYQEKLTTHANKSCNEGFKIVVKDLKSGQILKFNSTREAERMIGIPSTTTRRRYKKQDISPIMVDTFWCFTNAVKYKYL